MVLQTSPFDYTASRRTDKCTRALMLPMDVLINTLLGSLKMTTKETVARYEQPCYERYVILSFLLPTLLLLILLYLPIFGINFLIWSLIQGSRRPYRCDVNPAVPYKYDASSADLDIVIVTSDTDLLPEYLARRINVSHTQTRARTIGAIFSEKGADDNFGISMEGDRSLPGQTPGTVQGRLANYGSNVSSYTLPGSVTTMFPIDVDFLCLQGVFDERARTKLAKALGRRYPHIISDVTVNSWHTNFYCRGSGLITASRYRIIDADFLCFSHFGNDDASNAKGILYAKVLLGEDLAGRQLVGVICNLHLQTDSGPGAVNIRTRQLTDVRQWLQDKVKSYELETNREEVVVFDVICGNFEFDNMSTTEQENWEHPLILDYTDICRLRPGLDHDWAPGTKLVRRNLYRTGVASPAAMKSAFDTPEGRTEFIEDARVLQETQDGATEAMNPDGRRRTSRILYKSRDEDHARRRLSLENIRVVTQLATLTNHLPLTGHFRIRPVGQQTYLDSSVSKDMFIMRNERIS